eukprot:5912678-Prymnesium_polylepis.1
MESLRTPCLALRSGPRFAWRTSVREQCMMRFPARRGEMGGSPIAYCCAAFRARVTESSIENL